LDGPEWKEQAREMQKCIKTLLSENIPKKGYFENLNLWADYIQIGNWWINLTQDNDK
jgi:hypothetical protein